MNVFPICRHLVIISIIFSHVYHHSLQLLRARKPNAPQEWLSRSPLMAKRLEETSYRSAPTFIEQRLQQPATQMRNPRSQQQRAQQMGHEMFITNAKVKSVAYCSDGTSKSMIFGYCHCWLYSQYLLNITTMNSSVRTIKDV